MWAISAAAQIDGHLHCERVINEVIVSHVNVDNQPRSAEHYAT